MGNVSILAEHLSKKYTIMVGKRDTEGRLSDRLTEVWKKLLRFNSGPTSRHLQMETIWPLKDVSFEITHGEVVGIIGRNGAGKSTLLKVLSRITEPTRGRAMLYGRVGSLLEVGTGFHPELSGRDNIYLSGTILGMKKTDIDTKFDEIIAFSGIEKFVDTPVKRYSSGMYVRLGFAVAAHLEPEILIVDEVLAVGDAQFQQRCLNKMQDIAKEGRTVIFVSHNMQAIARLCQRAIFIDDGRVIDDGSTHQVVSSYLHSGFCSRSYREWPDLKTAPGDETVRLCAVRVRNAEGRISDTVDIRQSFSIELEFEVLVAGWVLLPHFGLVNDEGECLFEALDLDPDWRGRPRPLGRYISTGWIPGNLLAEGTFFVNAFCMSLVPERVQIREHEVVVFQIVDSLSGDSARGDYMGEMPGMVRPMLKWATKFTPNSDGLNKEGLREENGHLKEDVTS